MLTARGRVQRKATALAVACVAWAAVACGGGGGGGGGGVAAPTPQAQTSVTLAWAHAGGPVAGYDVWVTRNGAPWTIEQSVASSSVTLKGKPGSSAQMAVSAYDANGFRGPISMPSPSFEFPKPQDPTTTGGGSTGGTSTPPSSGGSSSGGSTSGGGSGGTGSGGTGGSPSTPFDPNLVAGGILWQSAGVLRVTDPSVQTLLVFATPTSATQLATRGDVDGDGLDDPIWVDGSGQLSYTPMADLAADPNGTAPIFIGPLTASEQVIGSGDVDGDGFGDVLVLGAGGVVDAWLTHPGGGPSEITRIGGAGADAFVVTRDFDGSGTDDLVWRAADGTLSIWLMDPVAPAAALSLPLPAAFEVLGAGDFDGDAAAELVLRDAKGDLFVLYPLSATPLTPVDAGVAAPGWSSLGTNDLDRDGTDDLVLTDGSALRIVYWPGEDLVPLDPASPWLPIAPLR